MLFCPLMLEPFDVGRRDLNVEGDDRKRVDWSGVTHWLDGNG